MAGVLGSHSDQAGYGVVRSAKRVFKNVRLAWSAERKSHRMALSRIRLVSGSRKSTRVECTFGDKLLSKRSPSSRSTSRDVWPTGRAHYRAFWPEGRELLTNTGLRCREPCLILRSASTLQAEVFEGTDFTAVNMLLLSLLHHGQEVGARSPHLHHLSSDPSTRRNRRWSRGLANYERVVRLRDATDNLRYERALM